MMEGRLFGNNHSRAKPHLWVWWRPKRTFLRLRACFATCQHFQPSFTNDLDKKRHFLHIMQTEHQIYTEPVAK